MYAINMYILKRTSELTQRQGKKMENVEKHLRDTQDMMKSSNMNVIEDSDGIERMVHKLYLNIQ